VICFAAAALSCICNEAFKILHLKRLYVYVLAFNKPSYMLLRKQGFKEEGLLRKFVFHRRKWLDGYILSLLNYEFSASQKSRLKNNDK